MESLKANMEGGTKLTRAYISHKKGPQSLNLNFAWSGGVHNSLTSTFRHSAVFPICGLAKSVLAAVFLL